MHAHQHNNCNWHFSVCLRQNVEESGYAISSWSASTGYSTLMLIEGAKLTRLPLVNCAHPQLTSLLNILCYLIMIQWITLHNVTVKLLSSLPPKLLPTFSSGVLSRAINNVQKFDCNKVAYGTGHIIYALEGDYIILIFSTTNRAKWWKAKKLERKLNYYFIWIPTDHSMFMS